MDEVKDMLGLIAVMERGCIITSQNVDILCAVLTSDKDKQTVYEYKSKFYVCINCVLIKGNASHVGPASKMSLDMVKEDTN